MPPKKQSSKKEPKDAKPRQSKATTQTPRGRSKPIPIPKSELSEKDKEELEDLENQRQMKQICDEAAWRFVMNIRHPNMNIKYPKKR